MTHNADGTVRGEMRRVSAAVATFAGLPALKCEAGHAVYVY